MLVSLKGKFGHFVYSAVNKANQRRFVVKCTSGQVRMVYNGANKNQRVKILQEKTVPRLLFSLNITHFTIINITYTTHHTHADSLVVYISKLIGISYIAILVFYQHDCNGHGKGY